MQMNNNMNNRVNFTSETAAVAGRSNVAYGIASGVEVPAYRPTTQAVTTFWDRLQYFYCEYFKGVLLLACSLLFVFAIPVVLTRPHELKVMLNRAIKRVVDLVGAVVGLLLTLPLFIILPILIKLDSPGPVFYTQVRIGVNRRRKNRRTSQWAGVSDRRIRERRREDLMGKPFKVIKFRTMIRDAEKKCGPVWATRNDPRITRVGRILRKTRLDEIPQFINVLKGDMSLVGPRPERPNFVRDLAGKVSDYSGRLSVKPGLTGLAQIENGYDSSVASVNQKVRLDLEYIRNWSIWTDLKILCRTVVVVLTGKGAC
jgi:lipopolysaccharide/colanic/teichoic acid biosynthesis glycosyltransferase